MFLLRWLSRLPRPAAALLLLTSEQLYERPDEIFDAVFRHIGIPPQPVRLPHKTAATRGLSMLPETEQLLRDFYAPFNRRLRDLTPFHDNYRPKWIDYGNKVPEDEEGGQVEGKEGEEEGAGDAGEQDEDEPEEDDEGGLRLPSDGERRRPFAMEEIPSFAL